jgi:glutamine amidotransferase
MNIAIVKYNAGNIQSVKYALERLGVIPTVTDNHEVLKSADKVIFPGVGEAATAMRYLHEANLVQLLPTLQQPMLGICLGLQLMCRHSEEGNVNGLGIFDISVRRFQPQKIQQKVPHMGWNTIQQLKSPLMKNLDENSFVYFVHSYYAPVCEHTIATCDYILPFSAALHKDNFYAAQFHPEKSSTVGEQILRNFLALS